MEGNPLLELEALGQSVWLDDLHRRMLTDGTLRRLIEEDGVTGLTSNPAILAAAITQQEEYTASLDALLPRTASSIELYEALVVDDIRAAADLFRPVYERSDGRDGFVSLEVSPHLAYDTAATVAEAQRLWRRVDRPNLLIKVPGTHQGLEAVTALIAAGVNVNITLLFSPARYRAVVEAYIAGLEERVRRRQNVHRIASVASFFLSRIDTLADRRLDELARAGREEAGELRGRMAIACACRAYEHYLAAVRSDRWLALARRGAATQRLLWASTSTKDPRYPDTRYVDELIAPETINTMPMQTLEAYRDHGRPGRRFDEQRAAAEPVIERLARLGITIDEVAGQLEREGVRKFVEPFDRLQEWLQARRAAAVAPLAGRERAERSPGPGERRD